MRPAHGEVGSHGAAGLLALLVTVLWSSSWVLIRWGLDDEGLTPVMFAALRYGLAAVVLVLLVVVRERDRWRRSRVDSGFVGRVLLLGIVMYALTQGAMFIALDEQPAATTSLVLSLTPLLVATGAAITLSEVPTRWQLVGVVAVALGAWLYFAGDLDATAAGMAAAIVALLSNVAAAILGRGVNRAGTLPALTITTLSMGAGAGALVIVALAVEGMPVISMRAWLIIVWLAVVNTALAFWLWNLSLQRLSAVESASINNTMLVQVALLAWLVLGEAPGTLGLLGIALVSVGVGIVQASRRRQVELDGSDAFTGPMGAEPPVTR